VVLVHFPFTSLRASKKRPAVVVSPTEFSARNDDVVVMALTSVGQGGEAPTLDDWPEAGLVKPTWVKPLLATLALEVIAKRLGRLSARDCRKVAEALRSVLAAEFLHR
jgi:mRNA interferase MazF